MGKKLQQIPKFPPDELMFGGLVGGVHMQLRGPKTDVFFSFSYHG